MTLAATGFGAEILTPNSESLARTSSAEDLVTGGDNGETTESWKDACVAHACGPGTARSGSVCVDGRGHKCGGRVGTRVGRCGGNVFLPSGSACVEGRGRKCGGNGLVPLAGVMMVVLSVSKALVVSVGVTRVLLVCWCWSARRVDASADRCHHDNSSSSPIVQMSESFTSASGSMSLGVTLESRSEPRPAESLVAECSFLVGMCGRESRKLRGVDEGRKDGHDGEACSLTSRRHASSITPLVRGQLSIAAIAMAKTCR